MLSPLAICKFYKYLFDKYYSDLPLYQDRAFFEAQGNEESQYFFYTKTEKHIYFIINVLFSFKVNKNPFLT